MSKRSDFWQVFAIRVLNHINEYAVPQYGDYPDDYIEKWSAGECVRAIGKYAARYGSNSRKGQEKLDLLKIAHFAQLAYDKLED